MGDKTTIEWTDATWNPVTGCTKVSQGCKFCYAERVFPRAYGKQRKFTDVQCHPNRLVQPLQWKKPRRIFVNSMSDLFHEAVPDEFINRVFAIMGHCSTTWYRCAARDCDHYPCPENSLRPHEPHIFQVLTKRPERALKYLSGSDRQSSIIEAWHSLGWYFEEPPIESSDWPFSNVHLGVSVEDQETANERIPLLLQTPAAVRFISAEPLLGDIDLVYSANQECRHDEGCVEPDTGALICRRCDEQTEFGLDWVIVGGESGPNARPMHPSWARSLRDQCAAAGVPYFFKQWGEWTPGENVDRMRGIVASAKWFNDHWSMGQENLANEDGHIEDEPDLYRVGKKAAGSLLDGMEHKEFP